MDKEELIDKIMEKANYSGLVRSDVEKILKLYERKDLSDEEIVKKVREFLRINYSGFSGKKIFRWTDKEAEEILKKHLSTRERYKNYDEVYGRILRKLPKEFSVIDLGAGVNGFSYNYFKKYGKVNYLGIEAVGQLVNLTQNYFESEKLKSARAVHGSLFELEKVKKLIKEMPKPRVVFMFKVVDALEKVERDYTKRFLDEIMPLADRVVISFATESWFSRRKFYVQRNWLTDFIKERWQFTDDFNVGGERYLVVENR